MVAAVEHSPTNTAPNDYAVVPLARIRPSPLNPRKVFDPEALQELADSIAQKGILEPLVTRYVATSGQPAGDYELLAGERRWRAAQLAGLAEAPVIVRYDVATDEQAVQLMLVENLQRADLDPIEEAEAYRQLNSVGGLTQSQIAAAVHRSQPTIANAMRVLDLPPAALDLVRQRKLTRGHGVALLRYQGFPAFQAALAEYAVTHELKVKDVEGTDVLGHAELRATKTYREIDRYGDRPPYKTICPQCPFGAYVPDKWGGGYCLRPEHYAELGAAARKEQKAALAAALEAAQVDPKQAPSFESLGQGATLLRQPGRSVNDYRYYAEDAPPGCGASCPCRVTCTHGGKVLTACRDRARLRRLQNEARDREQREQQEAALRRVDAIRRRFAQGKPPKATRLASLLATAVVAPRHFRPLLGVGKDVELSDDEIRTALAELTAESVLTYAAKIVLESAARDPWRWEYGNASPSVAGVQWFFGGDPLHQARTLEEIRAEERGEGSA